MTGEHFQPVRLHYKVLDQPGLQRAFKKLGCLDYDRTQQRWAWLYDHEAKRLRFKQSYGKIPELMRPIVIGSFLPRSGDQLLLDLRSCERAILAIPFFDKHLPRSVVRVTEAEVVHEHQGVVMSEHLLRIRNHHSAACGDPPIVSDEDPDIYIGYFENRHGEQWLFTCHRKTRKVELRGGDIDWNTVHKVENGTVEGLILNAEERAWLQACWRAAVSW